VTGRRLHEHLRDAPLPGEEDARERAWTVVSAAYAARPASPRHGLRRRPTVVLVAAGLLAAVALALPAVAVGTRLVRSLGGAQLRDRPLQIPAAGRLLAVSSRGTFVVRADGSRRRLGDYTSATWSPHGLNVLAQADGELRAIAPWSAQMRWPRALGTGEHVSQAAWSRSDGWRVAYIAGRTLRVANGDGTGDHPLPTAGKPVALAWRPLPGHARHELAVATATGALSLGEEGVGVSSTLWTRRLPGAPLQLDWSADGRRLAALLPSGDVLLLDAHGRLLARLPVHATRMAFAPHTGQLALITRSPATGQWSLVIASASGRRPLYSSVGRLGGLAWSPDGRYVVVASPHSDAWIFLPLHGTHVTFAQPASRLLGGGSFPQIAGWSP
jgi:hypothetical protein